MVFLPPKLSRAPLQNQNQVLSPRDTGDNDLNGGQDGWNTMQITTPIIVGVGLIILFIAYIIWRRWSPHSSRLAHHYRRVLDAIVQVFMPKQRRRRVQHVSTSITLDDSMATPRHPRRPQHSYIRSDSTDSQTPLTDNIEFYYPPQRYVDPSRGPMFDASQEPEKRVQRWWRTFRFGPREVKSQLPNHRFRVEGPDGSSVGHGESSLDSPDSAVRSGWISGLPSLPEHDEGDPNRGFYDRVIQIGDPQITVNSALVTPAHHDGVADVVTPGSAPASVQTPAPEYSSAVEYPFSGSNLRTVINAPATVIPQSPRHNPRHILSDSSAPPMYSSVSHSNHPSVESIIHDSMRLYPGPVGRSLPHRQISTESMLASSTPMVTQNIY